MGIINLKFRHHEISVNSDDEDKIRELSDRLNDIINKSTSFKNVTDTKLLYLVALTLLDDVETLGKQLEAHRAELSAEAGNNNKVLCDTLNYVAEYLENIADRLEK